MKPFEQLNNIERARLLHQLFPGEIPALIQTMKNICGNIIDHPEFFPQIGEEALFTPGAWLAIASSIHNRLTKYTNRLNRSSRLFSFPKSTDDNSVSSTNVSVMKVLRRSRSKSRTSPWTLEMARIRVLLFHLLALVSLSANRSGMVGFHAL